jgi:hypothetical protein
LRFAPSAGVGHVPQVIAALSKAGVAALDSLVAAVCAVAGDRSASLGFPPHAPSPVPAIADITRAAATRCVRGEPDVK